MSAAGAWATPFAPSDGGCRRDYPTRNEPEGTPLIEHEVKLRVESHDGVRRRLVDLGAAVLGRVTETNRIFDRPDGMIQARGCGLRVRTAVAEDGRSVATMTFKGPVLEGIVKSREEIEVMVGDAETAARLLEGLGFTVVLSYQKRRESWRFGGCQIELDEPRAIGKFVEIEGPSLTAIEATQRALGLEGIPHEPQSYVQLLMAQCAGPGTVDLSKKPRP